MCPMTDLARAGHIPRGMFLKRRFLMKRESHSAYYCSLRRGQLRFEQGGKVWLSLRQSRYPPSQSAERIAKSDREGKGIRPAHAPRILDKQQREEAELCFASL